MANPWLGLPSMGVDIYGNEIPPEMLMEMEAQGAPGFQGYMNPMLEESTYSQIPVAPSGVPLNMAPSPNPMSQIPVSLQRQYQAALEDYEKKIKEGALKRESGIAQLEQYAKDFQTAPRDIDWRPLTAYLATINPNYQAVNQLANQVAPMSEDERKQKIFALNQAIEEQRSGLSKDQLDSMRSKLYALGLQLKNESSERIAKERAKTAGANLELARMRFGSTTDRYAEDQTQKLMKAYGDVAPNILEKIKRLDENMPGGIEASDEAGDIPGAGVGSSVVPDFMLSPEASAIQQDARGLVADLIKVQSGAAATDKEVDRKLKEFGIAPGSKESTFRRGIQNLKSEVIRAMQAKEAAFKPEINKLYQDRGGISSKEIEALYPKQKQQNPTVKEWQGKKYKIEGNRWVPVGE